MITLQGDGENMKKQRYQCIPGAAVIPGFFFFFMIIYLFFFVQSIIEKNLEGIGATCFFVCICFIPAIATLPQCIRRVEIRSDYICCRGILPRSTFTIDWDACSIGMDYHCQSGRKVWWIYVCDGTLSNYMPPEKLHKINSVKIKPGFVRIMYSDRVYTTLLEVLPKKQQTALISARRCAGL